MAEDRKTVIVLGAYGEFIGKHLARNCASRSNLITKILVREDAMKVESKKAIVDELVGLGCVIAYGDASTVEALVPAFEGCDYVISALGGWGNVGLFHENVYAACKIVGNIKRIVPAQFGFDILSLPAEDMDDYMKAKRAWNLAAISSGLPYTIVSQGAFSQWMICTKVNKRTKHSP